MPQKPEPVSFPNALILNDGGFTTPQGNLVQTNYVDLSGRLPMEGFTLAKASEPQFDLRSTDTIRLSRPGVFRTTGEVLVTDDQEGQVSTVTRETVQEHQGQEELDRRTRALNAAMRLCRTKMSTKSTTKVERTETTSARVTFGNDYLIYSTSILPESDEKETALRRTFPDNYTSVAQIYRPRQFALALGFAICEHVGASGELVPMTGTYEGFKTGIVERIPQMVLHGPVLYVDNPYLCIKEAGEGWAKICSMIFVKSKEYEAQNEYRFATLSISPKVGDVIDLPVSGMMEDSLKPVNTLVATTLEPQVSVAEDATETAGKSKISDGYIYRRRLVNRQWGNWDKTDESERREREEIVEELVTSPDGVPEPFPSVQKQPDVIIFHQVGSRCRFVHHAYRSEETEQWHYETVRKNPQIVDDPRLNRTPDGLEVPEDVRFGPVKDHPIHPEYILDLCLDPSVPKSPMNYSSLKHFSPPDVSHAMACFRSLGMAVDLLVGVDQERAAASAWYAFRFILDLVGRFGPIVKSLCVIIESVVVVELERAPFSEAVAWVTFSGSGTYTLYTDHGSVEDLVFTGQFSRAEPMSEATMVETLRKHGWVPRDSGRD